MITDVVASPDRRSGRSNLTDDHRYMTQAIRLARKAEGRTSPNPLVGAVIVKDGKIVGEGYHRRAGLPHAEAEAINRAKRKAKGATLYVTLEPCDHFGKTPPCCDKIISSGIKKIKIAMKDPNPINNGKGIRRLKARGIGVNIGICKKEAETLNEPYIKFMKKKMPYVTAKLAQSLDGKIATKLGESKWISGERSREFVQDLRSKADAVMVGINTVLEDNPLLTVRDKRLRSPVRVIVDSKLKIPADSKLLKSINRAQIIIAATEEAAKSKIRLLENKGAAVIIFKSKNGRVPLESLLRNLAKNGIIHVLAEGGGELIGSLFDRKLIDRFIFIISNKIIGGKAAPGAIGGSGIKILREAKILNSLDIKKIGGDLLLTGKA